MELQILLMHGVYKMINISNIKLELKAQGFDEQTISTIINIILDNVGE